MKSARFPRISVLGCLALLFAIVNCEKADSDIKEKVDPIWKSCQGEEIDNPELLRVNDDCMANVTQKNEKKSNKLANNLCFRACQWTQLGWVYNENESSKRFNRTKALSSVARMFPEDVHIHLQSDILKCAKSDSAEGLSLKRNCRSYAILVKCVDKAVRQNCKGPRGTKRPLTTINPGDSTSTANTTAENESPDGTDDVETSTSTMNQDDSENPEITNEAEGTTAATVDVDDSESENGTATDAGNKKEKGSPSNDDSDKKEDGGKDSQA